jgi:hypothetical protein
MVIYPYKFEDIWMFDDSTVELYREPFVSGIPEIIEILVKEIPNAHKGFRLLFSKDPFPNYQIKLAHRREEYGGNWYYCEDLDCEGWLCPALFRYFQSVPSSIYCKAEAR